MAFRKVTYSETQRVTTVEPIRDKNDLKRIHNWFIEHDLEKYAILFKFGCYTGLRASDIVSFQVKDLYKKDRISIREVKTGKAKSSPIKPLLQDLINNYIEKHNLSNEEYIFGGRGDKEIDRSQVYRCINNACKELGITANVGTHTMRKTFGYHHYKQFHDVALLQNIFNHASPDVTLRYIGITQEEMDQSILDLNLEDDDPQTLEEIALKGNNRNRINAIISFCKNYLKYTHEKGIHTPFVHVMLDLIFHTSEYQY